MNRVSQNPDLPVIRNKSVRVTDFGADSTGAVRCDAAFENAKRALGEEGGKIIFPAGEYFIGPLQFTDGLEVHLEKGATVRFSGSIEDYLPPVLGVYEGIRCYRPSALLHAEKRHDIAITGEGVLDGQGAEWWDMVRYENGPRHMMASAEAGEPVENRVYTTWQDGVRPCFLEFLDCERVLIQGVIFKDSPMWTVHPTWCRQVTVRGIRINNPMKDRFHHSPNTDGVNLDGCDTALVEDCDIFCGDDCVCMKSGKNADGRAAGHICQNVEVRNCRFERGIGGITMGSETSGSIRNLYCHDIWMKDVTLGIWVKSTPERGGFIENLNYENITIENAALAGFNVMLNYSADELDGKLVPPIHGIHAENVTLEDGRNGIMIEGLKDHEPYDISIKDSTFRAQTPITVTHAKQVTLENVNLDWNPKYTERF